MRLPISKERILAQGNHNGHDWAVVYNRMGFRCGYVKVNPGHSWHGKCYDQIDVCVHGGLTFSEADEPCEDGGPDDGWWLGFDCAHYDDAPDPELPGYNPMLAAGFCGTIKDQGYVKAECRSLCEQAAEANSRTN